ncbi:lysophospholipid acyltransferase family protein [Piscinibacter sakaiensis]
MLHGTAIAVLRFPAMDEAARHARIRWWSARLLQLMGVEARHDGRPRGGATLVVANHVSWLDILALHAHCPQARFVSKADVRRWPVLGRLVASAGTLFIERERKRDALRVVHELAAALQAGQTVAVFPEGTTSDGHGVLPFHANLLQAAIAVEAPVQPVALRYRDAAHAVSPAVNYVGDVSLLRSLWWVACAEGLQVSARWLDAEGTRHADRRRLAERLAQRIGEGLG